MLNIIAEIGTSHEGSVEKAKQLIDAAAESGADTIKFQWVYADEILHPNTGFVKLPTGNIPLYERFKQLECDKSFYIQMQEYVHSKGCKFCCSPFGLRSMKDRLMINPVITKKTGEYHAEESCLSLDGVRPCTRYKEIEVDYLDQDFQPKHGKYNGFTAQIIQHEIDHFEGTLI